MGTISPERFELPEKKCIRFLLFLSLSLWEELFNGIKHKYRAYKLGFVQKIRRSGYIVPKDKECFSNSFLYQALVQAFRLMYMYT